jgi:transcriptional regulator with GAF, ATPase, and Fis domain
LRGSTLTLVDVEQSGRYAKAWFSRPGVSAPLVGWVPLQPQPVAGLTISVVWFVLQLGITLMAALAHWQRPFDRPLRLFLITSIAAMAAFIGGSHWWVISGNLWLLLPFAAAAIMLPAVLLHFFLVFPSPKLFLAQRRKTALAAVYAPAALAAASTAALVLAGSWLSTDLGRGPLAAVAERLAAFRVEQLLPWLRTGISWYILLAAGYFVLSLTALLHSFYHTRRRFEHDQVRWILIAAAAATVPLSYTLLMTYVRRVEFAFGAAQTPLFIASLLFMAAYAVGIVRHRLMLIDQVLSRGMMYYAVSTAVTLLFSVIVAFGTMATVHQDMALFGQPILVFVVLNVAVMALVWLRDRMQRGVDREFFREKYQLDKALQRVNQAVTGMLDRRTLADRVLHSCREVLQAENGAIYLRDQPSRSFVLLTSSGADETPRQFEATREFVEILSSGLSLQRVRSGASPVQQTVRMLNAELIHGLDVDGSLAGMVVLGPKSSGAAYNAEDAAFLAALGRVAGVTLHFGKVHEDLTRMNEEFVRLNEELGRRSEEVLRLQGQLEERDGRFQQQQRQIESLEHQLSLQRPEQLRVEERGFEAPTILGKSPAIRGVLETVRKVAVAESSVLIRGESGTGKELLARALHENSPRRGGPLISVHCAALAPGVLESELFGHVRGAFTDARSDKIGRFQMANGGTLFLDEIGDVPLETQVKLLRVLQERVIEPVGSGKPVPVDVRLIAATHRDLEQFIAEGKFREDLYYRLNVISIMLPPLRERGDDIVELAVQFLRRAAQRTGKSVSHFDELALERLRSHAWPGNIRELENVVERAVVLAESDRITATDLPPQLAGERTTRRRERGLPAPVTAARSTPAPPADFYGSDEASLLTEVTNVPVIGSDEERQALKEALARANGNKARAARLMGMPRSTYFSKLKKHGLE